jgi:hypothetical protein
LLENRVVYGMALSLLPQKAATEKGFDLPVACRRVSAFCGEID